MLEKVPESPDERNQLLAEHFEYRAYLESLKLTHIQKTVIEFLLAEKGFSPQNIEINKVFPIKIRDIEFNTRADIILKIKDKNFAFVKCAINSLESWERFAIAFCRVVDSYQIPYALITDGENIRFINILTRMVSPGTLNVIPPINECESLMQDTVFKEYPEDRKEMEKRIVYAFEGIKCSQF